jgi:lytic murein transglycosylase
LAGIIAAMKRWLAAALVVLGLSPAAAIDRAAVERQFQTWLTGELWPRAEAAGVARSAFAAALDGITLDWSLPDLQPPGEPVETPTIEWQAEFRSPAPYFGEAGLKDLARQGRALLARWRTTLDRIEARYGVPAEILLAIWGKESSYGNYRPPYTAIRTLATEGFMGRRAALYREELIAALKILQNGDVAEARMRSSWAGGLGQPQFQPRLFLVYAVDFDGDGRRDIWDSVPDSLASIANFLVGEGWQRGVAWGYEVRLPQTVSCALDGPEQARPMTEWASLGVRLASGAPLPAGADAAFLTLPAGRYGPAFLATANFNVIKQYNRSDLYALYIGHLADRYADDRPFRGGWEDVGHLTRADVRTVQEGLAARGFEVGTPDGLVGYRTRSAVGRFQAEIRAPATCLPDADLLARLR